jgi:mannose-6-phosphate isomerase
MLRNRLMQNNAQHPQGLPDAALRFASDFIPAWLEHAMPKGDAPAFVIEQLGTPEAAATSLTQTRIIFTLAHLYLTHADPLLLHAARRIYAKLTTDLRDADGGFRQSTAPGGSLRRSYDQSFALLALATLHRADPALVTAAEVEACWAFITAHLTLSDGSLREDDIALSTNGLRSQNPHMHMLEAVLQCHEMTGASVWLDRAAVFVSLAAGHFIDPETGAVREFVGPNLMPLQNPQGARREPGHQYEWAWLLRRYAGFTGDRTALAMADRMQGFVETYGLRDSGPLQGAPYDALDAQGRVTENTHLLWPLTEAGKLYAAIARDTGSAQAARAADHLAQLIFTRYVTRAHPPLWVNQLDGKASVTWDAALSRLLYHIALFVTELQTQTKQEVRP